MTECDESTDATNVVAQFNIINVYTYKDKPCENHVVEIPYFLFLRITFFVASVNHRCVMKDA